MKEKTMPLAYIQFLDGSGRPVDPGYGVPGGERPDQGLPGTPSYPDNSLPIPNPPPGKPGHLPSLPVGRPIVPSHPIVKWPPRPVDPDWGVDPIPNPPDGQPGHLPTVPPNWPIIPSHPWLPPRPTRPVDPGYGIPGGGWGHHPDHGLPGGGWGHPDQGLPGGGGHPDQGLPDTPPPSVPAGMVLVLVRSAEGKWYYAMVPQGTTKPVPPVSPPEAQPKA
jgi:hypothetical protein